MNKIRSIILVTKYISFIQTWKSWWVQCRGIFSSPKIFQLQLKLLSSRSRRNVGITKFNSNPVHWCSSKLVQISLKLHNDNTNNPMMKKCSPFRTNVLKNISKESFLTLWAIKFASLILAIITSFKAQMTSFLQSLKIKKIKDL